MNALSRRTLLAAGSGLIVSIALRGHAAEQGGSPPTKAPALAVRMIVV